MPESSHIPSSEITPPEVYFNRRMLFKLGGAAVSLVTTGAAYRRLNRAGTAAIEAKPLSDLSITPARPEDAAKGFRTDEPMSTLQQIGNYNNFYEFTTDKEGVAPAASGFVSRPWTVAVEGMVHKPKVFDLDEVLRLGPLEERVYRMRCVEGWSMVIPWVGLPSGPPARPGGAHGRREVRRLPDSARPHTLPGPEGLGAPLGPTSRDCGSTKQCIRSPSSRPVFTVGSCRHRMAHRSGSWCPGNMGSRESSRSSRSLSRPTSRSRRGIRRHRPSTGSSRT